MLYLIGLGLNKKSISLEGIEAIKKCKKIYLENYTVDFPYSILELEKVIGKKIIVLSREAVENDEIISEAKKKDICLLVYGCPLFATTHVSLLIDCKEKRVKTKIIYNASIFDAIAEIGLELYKFGKITSMPKWQEDYEPYSFLEYVEANNKIEAHSLILIDIGLDFKDAIKQLEKAIEKPEVDVKINKIIICSNMGNNKSQILYGELNKLKKKKVLKPFCIIIPSKMHFLEEEVVENFKI